MENEAGITQPVSALFNLCASLPFMNHKSFALLMLTGLAAAQPLCASTPIVISSFLTNPAGTDTPFEYVQLVATQSIDFSVTSFSVIWTNEGSGSTTTNGWVTGGTTTYGFNLTSGSVTAGQTFYVGGTGKLINGSGSTDISSATWIRNINTNTTGGDGGLGSSSTDTLGNGGSHADGIAVFNTTIASVTSSTIPEDALFWGGAAGTAHPGSGGFKMPTNDRYSSTGVFGDVGNAFLFSDPGGSQLTSLTGTFDTGSNSWTTARTSALVTLTASSPLSTIASQITVVPEPSTYAMLFGAGALAWSAWRRSRKHAAV